MTRDLTPSLFAKPTLAQAMNVNGVALPSQPHSATSKAPTPRGDTFEAAKDGERLGEQYRRVAAYMSGGGWVTLAQIAEAVGSPEASVSARLRDMRRGGYTVERRRVAGENGLHEYRATKNLREWEGEARAEFPESVDLKMK